MKKAKRDIIAVSSEEELAALVAEERALTKHLVDLREQLRQAEEEAARLVEQIVGPIQGRLFATERRQERLSRTIAFNADPRAKRRRDKRSKKSPAELLQAYLESGS